MKKFLFTSMIMLGCMLTYGQQQLSIAGVMQDSSLNAVANHPVWVNLYSNGNLVGQQQLMSDASGYYSYSVASVPNALLLVITNDCNGKFYSNSYVVTAADSSFDDTLKIGCQGLPAASCQSQLSQQTTLGTAVLFTDNTVANPYTNTVLMRSWIYGDGSGSTTYNSDTISHTYNAMGQYQVCLVKSIVDTTTQLTYCTDTACLVFSLSPPPSFCQASYVLDPTSSGGQSLVIYNNSQPAHNNTAFTTSYSWSFGDGGSSAQPFPIHSYAQAGVYEICLTITSVDASLNICTHTFCDSLGIDTAGNVVHKNGQGAFELRVLNPSVLVNLYESKKDQLKIYPNPASDELQVQIPDRWAGKSIVWSIVASSGQTCAQGHGKYNDEKDLKVNVRPLPNGVYHLQLQCGDEVSITKLMVN